MFQVISIFVIAVLVAIDQFTKYLAVNTIKINGPKEILFGTFQLKYTENTGAAFSAFSDNTLVLSVFTVLVIILCLYVLLARKAKSKFLVVGLVLVTAGGIGNVIDRIANGFVVDFFDPLFIKFAVFNVADIFVTCGAFLLIGYEIYELIMENKNNKAKKDD